MRARAWTSVLLGVLAACATRPTPEPGAASPSPDRLTQAATSVHRLSPTRHYRRIFLNLLGREPTVTEYEALLQLTTDEARSQFLRSAVDTSLSSPEFAAQMLDFGKDYLRIGSFDHGIAQSGREWRTGQSGPLSPCPAGTLHAGALGVFLAGAPISDADPLTLCDDAAAPINMVVPWWAPSAPVKVIGRAGTGARTAPDGSDCGVTAFSYWVRQGCSCGPNLVYCSPRDMVGAYWLDALNHRDESLRRQVFEESSRLFAHVIVNDRPFSDLVLGDYTVAPIKLRHLYARWARVHIRDTSVDDLQWWKNMSDPQAWEEIQVSKMAPMLLADRAYRFDPRTETGFPLGLPSAGVLTTVGSLGSFARERLRGARWLEIFACRVFAAPPEDAQFNPYLRDPAREGACQYCHVSIDAASIHFKRFDFPSYGGPRIGVNWLNTTHPRWDKAFIPNTVMTPVSAEVLAVKPNAHLIDFLDPGEKLLGATSDGTIGPLGFAKLVVQSGEFDRCAARRLAERFTGEQLRPGLDDARIDALTAQFVSQGRKVKPFIRALLDEPSAKEGW